MLANHGENGETCGNSPESAVILPICCHCERCIEDEDGVRQSPDSTPICEDCESCNCRMCEQCEETVWDDDTSQVATGFGRREGTAVYCDNCASNHATRCDWCSLLVQNDLISAPYCDTNDYVCNHCHENNDSGFYCEDCGQDFSNTDEYGRHGRCADCALNEEEEEEEAECTCYCGSGFNLYTANDFSDTFNSPQCYGIELETSNCSRFTGDNSHPFSAKHDGSIDGLEYVSCGKMRGNAGLSAVENFLGDANREGFEVNGKCGFHLHLDTEEFSGAQLASVIEAYLTHANTWRSFVSRSRRSNSFCGAVDPPCDLSRIMCGDKVSTDKDHVKAQSGYCDRYKWMNVASLRSHNTIEIRLHSGTLDSDKVCNWIKAHLAFWIYYRDQSPTGETLFEVFDTVDTTRGLSDFYRARQKLFV